MQRHLYRIGALCTVVVAGVSVAVAQAPLLGACAQIVAACEQAGFERGGAQAGNGIQVDCIRPIIQARAQRRRATKPLPQVAPDVVVACIAANPKFGQRIQAATQAQPAPAPLPRVPIPPPQVVAPSAPVSPQ